MGPSAQARLRILAVDNQVRSLAEVHGCYHSVGDASIARGHTGDGDAHWGELEAIRAHVDNYDLTGPFDRAAPHETLIARELRLVRYGTNANLSRRDRTS